MRTFAAKYRFKPQRPVQVELYPDHEDFAVRTVGLPGVGLLGVTFGYVIAMDSPSGRRPGSFHWGTTLWHEMAHVVTLEATNHLVPRWFSEGISVYEEWVADPAWGDRISPDVIKAIKDDEFLPIAELDGGFVRPKNPKQSSDLLLPGGPGLYVHCPAVGFLQASRHADRVRRREINA